MLAIPSPVLQAYQAVLDRNGVPSEQRPHYLRWLRYYLDFCAKYQYDPSVAQSVQPFEDKLIEKHQADWQRTQAFQAVALYHRLRVGDQSTVASHVQGSSLAGAGLRSTHPVRPSASHLHCHHTQRYRRLSAKQLLYNRPRIGSTGHHAATQGLWRPYHHHVKSRALPQSLAPPPARRISHHRLSVQIHHPLVCR